MVCVPEVRAHSEITRAFQGTGPHRRESRGEMGLACHVACWGFPFLWSLFAPLALDLGPLWALARRALRALGFSKAGCICTAGPHPARGASPVQQDLGDASTENLRAGLLYRRLC